ncbi:hypothetical protein GGS20DRAFT_464471 [Poronia punctata]|nr:hypothetical protein GGS20DRAFT_464471 [Poronia punctata]
MMATWAVGEKFHRVAVQPGSTPKNWDRRELVRCQAIGTGIKSEASLEGQVHPALGNWDATRADLWAELQQPLLLASRILETVGLPWVSDFLIDNIFDTNYPGSVAATSTSSPPYSIVRHHKASWADAERRARWNDSAQDRLRDEFPKSIQWQIDDEIFQKRGWNGYTCRHPRGAFSLEDLDNYHTIRRFDKISPHEKSRNLTALVMAEYPTRLAELRRQGKAQSEEYLLTAFMTTVTILHELGHAIYWRDRRALSRHLREPFYGADLEMELGDSFVASIFGGWTPVSIRELDRLKRDFSFADGIAWRQALSWDHHRIRPKYRAHYSIRVDYIARLFRQEHWSTITNMDEATALIRPQLSSIALQTVGLHKTLEHATAAIADFHCDGRGRDDGWVWNRRPGAWFRLPQFDDDVFPEFELPTPPTDAMREPMPREHVSGRDVASKRPFSGTMATPRTIIRVTSDEPETAGDDKTSSLARPISTTVLIRKAMSSLAVPRRIEDSPRIVNVSRAHAISVSRTGLGGMYPPRVRQTASPLEDTGYTREKKQQAHREYAKNSTKRQVQRFISCDGDENENGNGNEDYGISSICLGGNGRDSQEHSSEPSVEELKKRLSRLIGVSLAELEKLFEKS